MATLTPQVLLDGIVFPEGPRWHKGKLWFSDIFAGKVMTVDVAGRAAVMASVPERPSGPGQLHFKCWEIQGVASGRQCSSRSACV